MYLTSRNRSQGRDVRILNGNFHATRPKPLAFFTPLLSRRARFLSVFLIGPGPGNKVIGLDYPYLPFFFFSKNADNVEPSKDSSSHA